MATYACRRCGAEERNQRGDCLVCKRLARRADYARKTGRTPEPPIKPSAGPLWRLDDCDAERDPLKQRALRAAVWDAWVDQEFFHATDPTLDELHLDEMRAMLEPERSLFRDASRAEHQARQRAARHTSR